jgi:hypothetical protein
VSGKGTIAIDSAHVYFSFADFEQEPHRNKLNMLLNWTGHLAYHFGQVALLK